jgi:hypothetical protein
MPLERQTDPSWWGCLCAVCFASKKPSEREFFVPAGMDLAVKLLCWEYFRPILADTHHILLQHLCPMEHNADPTPAFCHLKSIHNCQIFAIANLGTAFKLQDALHFFRSTLIFSASGPSLFKKKERRHQQKHKITAMTEPTPSPHSPDCVPH